MKKTILLMIVSSLLLASCDLSGLIDNIGSDEDTSSESSYSESNKTSTERVSKYDAYKDRDWYGIGLESYTNYMDHNMIFEGLILHETLKKGKYTCDDDYYGHYNLFICENGDVAKDDLSKIKFFDFSEYNYLTTQFSDCSYTPQKYYDTKVKQKVNFYYELGLLLYGVDVEHLSYDDTKFNSVNDVYSFYGISIQSPSKGTVDVDDESSYICSEAWGEGATYDESYVFSTYMNCNPLFKFVGLPSFFTSSEVSGWDHVRKYTTYRGKRIWCDSKLNIYFDGKHTNEEIRSWIAMYTAAGYQEVSLNDSLDSESPNLSYKADIELLSFQYNSQSLQYLKNRVTLSYSPMKWDENNKPIEFSTRFGIEFCLPTVWDIGGKFIFHDDGLMFYYSDHGTNLQATLVNKSGELVTQAIFKDEDTIFSFSLPHKPV